MFCTFQAWWGVNGMPLFIAAALVILDNDALCTKGC